MAAPSKTYAIFDLDGTITKRDTYFDYLLSYFRAHPRSWIKAFHLGIYVLAYSFKIKDNTWLKQQFLSALFAGKSAEELYKWNQAFVIKTVENNIRNQAKGAIYLHKQGGHECVLLSASLDLYVPAIGKELGFEHVICTQAEWKNDRLTGRLNGENIKGSQKRIAWDKFIHETKEQSPSTIAYGDHATDLEWLTSVDHGVLVSSNTKLIDKAKQLKLEVQQW